jgi:hypothetical protein
MSIRREPTYLSREVWRWLWLIAKAKSPAGVGDGDRMTTADQMADEILRSHITEKFPQLLAFQKEVEKREREVIKTLIT